MAQEPQSGLSTLAVHGGEARPKYAHAVATPIVQTSTYAYDNMAAIDEYVEKRLEGEITSYEYGRYGNPTEETAALKLAALEGAEKAVLSSSGMSAVTTAIIALTKAGDHLIVTDEAYRKTGTFIKGLLKRFGVEHTIVGTRDYAGAAAAIKDNTVLLFSESPTNPHLSVIDIEKLVAAVRAKSRRVLIAVDSTFATPYNQRPLEFGVDLVIHSCTKYFAGHNDVLAGAVCGSEDLMWQVYEAHSALGGTLSPHSAYLLLRGMKTLSLRMARHNENGQHIAEWLEAHPKVEKVFYPGLPSHPDHEHASRQMRGFGGVVSFRVRGDRAQTSKVIDALRIPYLAASLGGVESLVYHPAALTFADCSPEDREALGLTDNLIRLSLGIEDTADLIADLDQALAKI